MVYLLATTGKRLIPSDASFETFSDTIQESDRHPDFISGVAFQDVINRIAQTQTDNAKAIQEAIKSSSET